MTSYHDLLWVDPQLRGVPTHPLEPSITILNWSGIRKFRCQSVLYRYENNIQLLDPLERVVNTEES
jgi:hypothetical protein